MVRCSFQPWPFQPPRALNGRGHEHTRLCLKTRLTYSLDDESHFSESHARETISSARLGAGSPADTNPGPKSGYMRVRSEPFAAASVDPPCKTPVGAWFSFPWDVSAERELVTGRGRGSRVELPPLVLCKVPGYLGSPARSRLFGGRESAVGRGNMWGCFRYNARIESILGEPVDDKAALARKDVLGEYWGGELESRVKPEDRLDPSACGDVSLGLYCELRTGPDSS
jgi:hypothetical protein